MNAFLRVALGLLGLPAMLVRPADPTPSTLTVYAAASLTDAFKELGKTLEASHPGLTAQFNFAGSQQLALQIEQGAPADVFASADQRWMDYAKEKGLIAGESTIFARNRLVAIVPRTNPARIRRLQDLVRKGIRLAIAVIGGRNPAHHSEAANVINVHHVQAVKRKVLKINPILAVGVTRQVELASLGHLSMGRRQNISY